MPSHLAVPRCWYQRYCWKSGAWVELPRDFDGVNPSSKSQAIALAASDAWQHGVAVKLWSARSDRTDASRASLRQLRLHNLGASEAEREKRVYRDFCGLVSDVLSCSLR